MRTTGTATTGTATTGTATTGRTAREAGAAGADARAAARGVAARPGGPGRVPGGARAALGRYGEDVAARHLTDLGLVVLERNWRCDQGEIDIVARDGADLVVCEVKTRRSDRFGPPQEAVTRVKLTRLRRLAVRWLQEHDVHPDEVRIDVVAVTRPTAGPAGVVHLRGVG